MSGVTIDRLVLQLPGIGAEAARELALGIAESLAAAGLNGALPELSLEIDEAAASAPGALAARIVAAVRQRIG